MSFVTSKKYNDAFAKSLGPLDELIRKYFLILGGSAVSANILGDNYEGSDFDVYTTVCFKMRNENEVDSEFDDEIVEKLGGVLILATPYRNFGKHNYKYICPNFTINIINVSVRYKFEIYDHLYRSTDLDICASTYNGYEARFPEHLLERKIISVNQDLIHDIDKLSKDKDISQEEWEVEKLRLKEIFILKRTTRAIKYADRGFFIATDLPINDHTMYKARIFNRHQIDIESSIHFGIKCLAVLTERNVDTDGDFVLVEDKTCTLASRIKKGEMVATVKQKLTPEMKSARLDYECLKWAKVWIDHYKK